MYTARINYDKKALDIIIDDVVYPFDLNEGDVGEFWHSLDHKGQVYDVNYHQDGDYQEPSIALYPVPLLEGEDEDVAVADYSKGEMIEDIDTYGDPTNYFGDRGQFDWDAFYSAQESKL
tara:strand:+ start:10355 stop:10711 length:357 start_codon:yes stop_codon:yes gene_type:complete